MMTQSNLKIIENYTTRSFVLTGNTKPYKEDLKNLYGKYNRNLKCGPGWVFSNKRLQQVSDFIENLKKSENNEKHKVVIDESTDDDANSDSEWLPEENRTDDESDTESCESEYDCVLIDNLKNQIKELTVSNNKLVKDLNKKDEKIKKLKSKICKLKSSLRRRNIEKLEVKKPTNRVINKYIFFMLLMFIGICLVNNFNIDVKDNIEFFKEKISNQFENMYKNLNHTYRNFDYNYFNNTYLLF